MARTAKPTLKPVSPLWRAARRRGLEGLKSFGVIAAVAVAVALGGALIFRALWGVVTNLDDFQLRPADQAMVDAEGRPFLPTDRDPIHPWVDFSCLQAYWGNVNAHPNSVLARKVSLFRRGLTRGVYETLQRSPWVREVRGVRRKFPNRLEIQLALRKPAYLVFGPGRRSYLLDDEGVLLDERFFVSTEELKRKPVIRLDFTPGDFQPGYKTTDPGVRGAMYMLDVFKDVWRELAPLAEIQVAKTRGNARVLTLIPKEGGRVLWGSPPPVGRYPVAGEAQPAVKMRNLKAKLSIYRGRLRLYEIDVRREPTERIIQR